MTVFNIAVVIVIRGLLDTEDEFDNPIIQGIIFFYKNYFLYRTSFKKLSA